MATKKISELTEATSLTLNDLLPIVNGNETKNTKLEALKNFLSLGYEGHTIYELNSTVNTLDISANTVDFADVIPKLNTLVNSHLGETLFIVIRDPNKVNIGSDNYLLFFSVSFNKVTDKPGKNYTGTPTAIYFSYSSVRIGQFWMQFDRSSDGTITINTLNIRMPNFIVISDDVLTKTNTSSYTPSDDYNPATKKYVDDQITSINDTIGNITTQLEAI